MSDPEKPTVPDWLTWRRRYGPLPPAWLRPWAPPPLPPDPGLPAPPVESAGLPPLPEVDLRLPAEAEAEPPSPPAVPVAQRLGFVLFGACFTVPPALILLLVFGRGLHWTQWLAYLGGGVLGLALLGLFFLGLTAPQQSDAR